MKWIQGVRRLTQRGDAGLSKLGAAIGILCTVAIIGTLSAGVISRYVFNRPFFWTDEVARILLIWSIFTGAAMGFRQESSTRHISMDLFVSLLPAGLKKLAAGFKLLFSIFFGFLMLVIGITFFIQTLSFRTAALDISKGFVYACLPLFALMMLVFLIHRLLDRR